MAAGCVAAPVAHAGAAADTLEQALSDASQSSPELAAAQAALRAIDERVPQARSSCRPSALLIGEEGVAHLSGAAGRAGRRGRSALCRDDDLPVLLRERRWPAVQ